MTVFDVFERNSVEPATHSESTYDSFNRLAWPEVVEIRNLIESWFQKYPAAPQQELKTRFVTDFNAAFFELMLHELMIRHSFTVDIHPQIPNTNRSPDFLVHCPDVDFYLEARVTTDMSDKQRSEANVRKVLYDQINTIVSTNFFLRIISLSLKGRQPSGKKLKQFLTDHLQTLDTDSLRLRYENNGFDELPVWVYSDDAIEIEMQPIPKSIDRRGKKEDRLIGMYPMIVEFSTTSESLKETIHKKSSRYGELDKPYLLAINSISSFGTDCQLPLN